MSLRIPLVALLGLTCTPSVQVEIPEIPVPTLDATPVEEVARSRTADGQLIELSLLVDLPPRSDEVFQFYSEWAHDHGWSLIDPSDEGWGTGEWTGFNDSQGRRILQRTAHYTDPSRDWSLRVLLRHTGSESRQFVNVQLHAFYLYPKEELWIEVDDLPPGL